MRYLRRLVVATLLVVTGAMAMVGLGSAPAGAVINGDCEGSGTITPEPGAEGSAVTVEPKERTGVWEVPYAGSVAWRGEVGDGSETDERSHNGEVRAEFPPGVDELIDLVADVGVWSWSDDDATTTAENGTETYEVPDWVPGGMEVVVVGFHDDPSIGVHCTGSAVLTLPGTAWDSPVTWGVLVATAGSAILVAISGRPKGAVR